MAAVSIGAKCPFEIILNGGYPTHRASPNPPKWALDLGVEKYTPGKAVYVPWVKKAASNSWIYAVFVIGVLTGVYYNLK